MWWQRQEEGVSGEAAMCRQEGKFVGVGAADFCPGAQFISRVKSVRPAPVGVETDSIFLRRGTRLFGVPASRKLSRTVLPTHIWKNIYVFARSRGFVRLGAADFCPGAQFISRVKSVRPGSVGVESASLFLRSEPCLAGVKSEA